MTTKLKDTQRFEGYSVCSLELNPDSQAQEKGLAAASDQEG